MTPGQPSQNAMALAQTMIGQQSQGQGQALGQPQGAAQQSQGLDIRGLLEQVQALQQSQSDGLPQAQPEEDPQAALHGQLSRMSPAQMLHSMGRAKAVAATMQHLRQLRPAEQGQAY